MTTSSASQPQLNMSADDAFDAIFAMVRTEEILCNFPALQEPHNVVLEDVQLTIQEGHHQIPGPPRTTSENGDPVTEQLLEAEQHDIEAVRLLLGLPILKNAITVHHYRCILTSLRDKLLELPPHEIPYKEAYSRILLRLVDRLVSFPGQENCEFAEEDCVLFLCRRNYDECIGKLLIDMAQGFILMRQIGTEDEVYVRNVKLHTNYLRYLASHLNDV